MKVHVHGIGACWMGATVDHVFGSGMVDLDGGWGMFVPQLLQNIVDFNAFSCVDVQDSKLGFCGRGNYCFNDFGHCANGAIVGWECSVFGKIMMSSGLASSIGFVEIAGIAVD